MNQKWPQNFCKMSSGLLRRVYSSFSTEHVSNWPRKRQKKTYFLNNFPSFHTISLNIPTDSGDWKVQNSEQGKMFDPVDFSEKFIATFYMENESNWNRK